MSKISEENGDSILNSENIEIREYQIEIANKCLNKNSLVVLPTGLGKTIIAVLVVGKTLEIFPKNSKVIVLAPTRPLINQHYNTFSKFLSISQEKFEVLTGKTLPEKRIELYKRNL
ncbi:MAG: DEAD/DEAH box helicase, partial [Promethearchaeota archaeon]